MSELYSIPLTCKEGVYSIFDFHQADDEEDAIFFDYDTQYQMLTYDIPVGQDWRGMTLYSVPEKDIFRTLRACYGEDGGLLKITAVLNGHETLLYIRYEDEEDARKKIRRFAIRNANAIIEQTGVKIDITDDGAVSICGTERAAMDKAIELIRIITTDFEAGQIFVGKVVSIKEFGAFLEFAPGKEGMVHISKISKQRINRVEDELTLGDMVKVVCLGKDKMGRISFSIKDVK